MCTANAAALQGFGMGMQLMGGIGSARANRDYHNANASYLESMNELNQIQANQAIESTLQVGGRNSSAVRNKGISLAKTQRAAMASHGLSQSATYQNILDDTITRSERDAMAVMYNADVQAKNIRTNAALQQAQYLSQAAQEKAAGRIAYRAGILSTIGQFADSWAKWSDTSQGKMGGNKWSGLPTFKGNNGKTYTYNGSMDWGRLSSPSSWNGVNARNIPVQNDDIFSNRKWMLGNGSGSLWGGSGIWGR
jgi:hypothetical protein